MAEMRPFKSLAEQTRLRKLVDQGTFPRSDFAAMLDLSRGRDLPERLTTKPGHSTTKRGPRKLSTSPTPYY